MVNGIGCLQIFVKQNRQRNVVINRSLKTTLTTSNNHNKFNENIYFGSKKPVTTDTYSRASNDESYTFCIFLGYSLHSLVDKNLIFEPLPHIHVGVLISDLFRGVCGVS